MSQEPLRIGLSSCFLYPDSNRNYFWPKTLLYAEQSMMHWVMEEGAIPMVIPTAHAPFSLRDIVGWFDGLLLQGGSDVAPQSYGEAPIDERWPGDPQRDQYEIELIKLCIELDKPILATCRGTQVLNVALGGTLFQDIQTQHPDGLIHRSHADYDSLCHDVTIDHETYFGSLYKGQTQAKVNSVHHQAIKVLAADLEPACLSIPDGIVEAVSLKNNNINGNPFVIGAQWHPEFIANDDPTLLPRRPMMKAFLDAIRQRRT